MAGPQPIDRADAALAPDPWERRPKETAKQFAGFTQYRNMGPSQRSIRSLARQEGRGITMYSEWSRKHSWVERALAWDTYLDTIWKQEMIAAQREMVNRHARVGTALISRALQRLIGDEAKQIRALELNDLTASDLVKMLDLGVKIERLSVGAPDQVRPEEAAAAHAESASELTHRILQNPKARDLALRMLDVLVDHGTEQPAQTVPREIIETRTVE
jgi:hypothetical protein